MFFNEQDIRIIILLYKVKTFPKIENVSLLVLSTMIYLFLTC